MRVLHVIPGLDLRAGGPAFALAGLAPALQEAGCAVTVLTTYRAGDDAVLSDRLRDSDVSVEMVGPVRGRFGRHPSLTSTVARCVAAADVVHIHALWEQPQHLAARAAQAAGKPYVIRPCGMLDPWSLQQSRWKKRLALAWRVRRNLKRAAALHFVSETERRLVEPMWLGVRSIVEPNGVNPDLLDAPPPPLNALRQRFADLPAGPLVLFLGRIHPKKGPDLLVDAFSEVSKRWSTQDHGPKPGLILAGPDEVGLTSRLRAQARHHGIARRVAFPGLLTDADRVAALRQADLFCLPSHQENFGIAVVEALAMGTPVVISDQVNIFEPIVEAGVGTAVPLQPADLSDALFDWLTDHAKRRRAAEKAGPWARERFGWPGIADRWARVHYPALLDRG